MKRISGFSEILHLIRPGATIVIHSCCAEPETLTRALAVEAQRVAGAEIVTLTTMGSAPFVAPALAGHLRLATFLPGRALRAAASSGKARVLRARISEIPMLFRSGSMKADVLLLQLSPPDEQGRLSLGISVDYMREVLDQDPLVIAEINPAMPRTCGDSFIPASAVDYVIEGREGLQQVPPGEADEVDRRIADHIAGLIPNGSTVQAGIGALPDLVMSALRHHRDLGLHSGIITDAVRPLIETGVITNARKKQFAGRTITTMAAGTQAFYDFLDRNPAVEFHPCSLTHDPALLASIDGLCAINGVLEIDLAGRANAERLGGRVISAPGGLPDFAAGAKAAPGGISIIALRATAKDGRTSRIRARLDSDTPSAVGAEHIDYVVTEHGVARLTGLSAGNRARALIAVAHPDFRADLMSAWLGGRSGLSN